MVEEKIREQIDRVLDSEFLNTRKQAKITILLNTIIFSFLVKYNAEVVFINML